MSSLEDYVFGEYVQSFKTASDRTKHALYAVTVACVLIATATWNIRPEGWARKRVERWQRPPVAAPAPSAQLDGRYAERVVDRMMILDIPALGISLDVNDLGIVGGFALLMLTCLLWLTIAREHENLYLGLFKVNSLARGDGERNNRDGKANLLYHALAMGQVLSRPPTLARWRRSTAVTTFFATLLFAMPALVQTGVTVTNVISFQELQKNPPPGGLPNVYLRTQGVIIALLIVLGALCWLHLRACAIRWRHTFFAINPDWKRLPQRPLSEWLKLPFFDHPLQRFRLLFEYKVKPPEDWVHASETLVDEGWARVSLADELFRGLRRNALQKAGTSNARLRCLRNARLFRVARENGFIVGDAAAEAVYRD